MIVNEAWEYMVCQSEEKKRWAFGHMWADLGF